MLVIKVPRWTIVVIFAKVGHFVSLVCSVFFLFFKVKVGEFALRKKEKKT